MNTLIMQFPIKPLSVNAKFDQHYKTGRIIKSRACKSFEAKISSMLERYRGQISAFSNGYTRSLHGLQLEVVMYVPKEEFFTKEGLMSLTCIDASNALKMLEDTIYKALDINDGLNVRVISEKRPYTGEEWLTLVTISEAPIPKVCYLDAKALEYVYPS